MFSSMLNKSMRDFEREIASKESALAQRTDNNVKHVIVSRPSSKPPGKKLLRHSAKDGKVSSETGTKKCALEKQSIVAKPRSTGSARASIHAPSRIQDNENIIHKEIIENTGATVEITVKTKAKERARKRSCSRSRAEKGLPRINNNVSSEMYGDEIGRNAVPSERMCPRYPNETDVNHRPWCELLKSRNSAFVGVPNHILLADAKQINSNYVIPSATDVKQSCEPSANFSKVHHNNEGKDASTVKRVKNIKVESALLASISSRTPNIVLDPPHGDAEDCVRTCDSSQYPKEINTVFTSFDPLRILNFLVRELQGIVSKNSVEGGSVKRIVTDMEETLRRLPERYKCVRCQQPATSLSPPTKPYESSLTAPVQDAPDAVALREEIKVLGERCSQLSKDKEKLEAELAEKSKKVEAFQSKGKEYLQRTSKMTDELTQMKKKNDEQMEMLTNLSKVTFQLKNENKVIVPLREAQAKLSSRLEEITQKAEKMETELQLVRLERDKFRVLLEDKTKDVESLKQLVKNIQCIVSEQLTNLKNLVQHKKAKDQLDNLIRAVSECSLKITSNDEVASAPEDVQSPDKPAARPRCSSPTSSVVSSSLAVSPSWQMISKISNIPDYNDDTNKASPLVILAHGSDSNAGEYSFDETVRFDDSKELRPEDGQKFCSLQSIQDLTASMQCGPQSVPEVVGTVHTQVQNKTVHSILVQGHETKPHKAEERLSELCKVFQDLSKNVLLQLNTSQPCQTHDMDADNSSDWTDYSDNV